MHQGLFLYHSILRYVQRRRQPKCAPVLDFEQAIGRVRRTAKEKSRKEEFIGAKVGDGITGGNV